MRKYRLFLLVVGLAATGCMVKDSKQMLLEAVQRYNVAFRWGRTEWMADHVPKQKRGELATPRDEFGDLQVTACEVGSVKMKGKDKALALVQINWYRLSALRLRSSLVEQTWKRHSQGWLIVEQRLVRGAPYPLLLKQPTRRRTISAAEIARELDSETSSDDR